MSSNKHNDFYCAFCKRPRRGFLKKHIDAMNVIGCALISAVLMFAFWNEFNPRVFMLFTFLLAVAEMVVQFRWRMSIVCQACGFDPVLYVKDPHRAASNVKTRLEKRKADPIESLTPIQLPSISLTESKKTQPKRKVDDLSLRQ